MALLDEEFIVAAVDGDVLIMCLFSLSLSLSMSICYPAEDVSLLDLRGRLLFSSWSTGLLAPEDLSAATFG